MPTRQFFGDGSSQAAHNFAIYYRIDRLNYSHYIRARTDEFSKSLIS